MIDIAKITKLKTDYAKKMIDTVTFTKLDINYAKMINLNNTNTMKDIVKVGSIRKTK